MNHNPVNWGRPSDDQYGPYNYQIANASNVASQATKNSQNEFPTMHTQQPMITGASVVAVKFNDGVVMATDKLGSYGSLLRLDDLERMIQVGDSTVVGVSGDISDFQYLQRLLDELLIEDNYDMEQSNLKASHVHEYLRGVFYNRRSKMNPLWNACVVAGFDADGEVFLKYVNLLGVSYSSPAIATGFGAYMGVPLLRQKVENEEDVKKLEKEDAIKLVRDCMKVLFYRDARSWDKYDLCVITKSTKKIEFQKGLECEGQSWKFARDISGYGLPQQ
ncbi:DEKNAAC105473 [Brettanomyces naardenensis]|uniref:Proteasome subunit beta n=1 Tax=Brettanomyces naardenensis TaxID=13370 RepID=A0A448YTJ2_BRENA|nr:DEKNAAC105473 [Brettanomyces naardenensis]